MTSSNSIECLIPSPYRMLSKRRKPKLPPSNCPLCHEKGTHPTLTTRDKLSGEHLESKHLENERDKQTTGPELYQEYLDFAERYNAEGVRRVVRDKRAVEAAEAAARIAEQAASAEAQGPSWAITHADTANDLEELGAAYAVDQHFEDKSGASAYQMNPEHNDEVRSSLNSECTDDQIDDSGACEYSGPGRGGGGRVMMNAKFSCH
ncbi:hypothetical protein K470DRAFT_42582 [Piedraia hortae CBS 480.64]|uniref:Uncharacterized protein n=1 Tax=Piedraia hortae CBS 480.64 TaxID=1314780 RepID=A0A6A7C2Y8_9PEZI|nr:hypothetical protein K470DRAFT_42582 [Piedraia hortae CBS 480.64]